MKKIFKYFLITITIVLILKVLEYINLNIFLYRLGF